MASAEVENTGTDSLIHISEQNRETGGGEGRWRLGSGLWLQRGCVTLVTLTRMSAPGPTQGTDGSACRRPGRAVPS
jgi:hypothetical protein